MSNLHDIALSWLKCIKSTATPSVMQPVMRLCLKSVNHELLSIYNSFIKKTIINAGGLSRQISIKRYELKRWTVLSSPFVHKKARTQFERRIYPSTLEVYNLDKEKCKTLLWYIMRNSPPNIDIEGNIKM